LIVYAKGKCWLTELAGLDDDPDYLALIERRLAALLKVAAHPDVKPHRVLRGEFMARHPAGKTR
jgi:hypothetical protein